MSARSSSPTPQIFLSAAKSRRASRSSRVISACIAGIVAVALLELDRQAFGEIARANAGRVEGLQDGQDGFDLGDAGTELLRRARRDRSSDSRPRRQDRSGIDRSCAAPDRRWRASAARAANRTGWFRRKRRLRDYSRRPRGRRSRCRPIRNSRPDASAARGRGGSPSSGEVSSMVVVGPVVAVMTVGSRVRCRYAPRR